MQRTLRIVGYLTVAAWIGFALYYVFDSRPMFAPYGDIGGEIFTTGAMGAAATSLRNVISMVGWQPWDYSTFVYLPMGEYAISIPLELLVRDAFRAEKLATVLQFTVAFFSVALCYEQLVGRSLWRWLAAVTYVMIPLFALQTRLVGFGWVAALMPAALALNIWLARRFGWRAAPAVGIACALASSAFVTEYAIFVGLPLLALSLAVLRWKGERIGPWFALAALSAFVLFPAYTVLVTISEQRLMDWITPRQAAFSALSLFSQRFEDQVANILREATLSADQSFNASTNLPYALFAGAMAWMLALTALGFTIARTQWQKWWAVAPIVCVCFILAFGPAVPLVGPPVWNAITHVPFLQAVRTPDRFEQIVALLVALGAAYGASFVAARGRVCTIAVIVIGVGLFGGLGIFDVREHILALQPVEDRLPDFGGVTDAVNRLGGRTVVLGFPFHGSQYDWAPYAPGSPRVPFAWDFAGRYGDGDGGISLLRRAAVRSVVTTPNWTRVSEAGIPADMAALAKRSRFASGAASFPHGVRVFTIEARSMIASVRPLCTYAGPAAFEQAAGLRMFDNDALVHDSEAHCTQTLFADYDPLDEVLAKRAIANWKGVGAFGTSEPLPLPNVFVVDRFGIAAPWYRNSYRGDSVLSDQPFLTYGYASTTLDFSVPGAGKYALFVRVSGLATLQTSDGAGRQVIGESRRVEGFGWVRLRLGELRAGSYAAPLEVIAAPESDMPVVVDSVIIAPSGDPATFVKPQYTLVSLRAFEPPLSIRSYQQLYPRPYSGRVSARGQSAVLGSGTHIGLFDGEMRITVTGRTGHVRLYWKGPTGEYVVAATGWFNEGAPTLTLATGGQTLEIRYDPSIAIAQSTAYARMLLVHGAPIDVTMDARPGGTAALTKIIAMPIQPEETPTSYDDAGETWEFGKSDPLQFYEAFHSSDVAIASGTIRAFPGVTAELPFDPVFVRGRVTADVQVSGGKGAAQLRCGTQSDRSDIGSGSENPGGAALVVERTQDVPCALSVQWKSETMTLESVTVHARGAMIANWSAQQYFARGVYSWIGARSADLHIDGRAWPASAWMALTTGEHLLTLRRAPMTMPPLIFQRAGAAKLPQPPALGVEERSATSWSVHAPAGTTLELAQFDDGNWFARTKSQTTYGYPCDLVNACFNVEAGDAYVSRRLPPILALGLTITILDVAIAIALLFLPELRARLQR